MKTFLEEGVEMRPGISLNFSQTTRAVFPSSCTQSNPCSSPGELLSCMSGEVSLIRPMFSSRSILLGCYGKGWSPVVSQFHLKCRQEMMIFVNRSPDYYSAFPIAAPWKHYKNIKLFDSPWILVQNSGSPRTEKKKPSCIWHSIFQRCFLTGFNNSLPPTSASALIDLMCHLCYSCLPHVFCKTWGIFILLFTVVTAGEWPKHCLACVSLDLGEIYEKICL